MNSSVTMRATATTALSRFSLDSAVSRVQGVRVNGLPAGFAVRGEKLLITPAMPLPEGERFTVRIEYLADRNSNPPSPAYPGSAEMQKVMKPWENTADGFALLGQPDRAHVFFPSDDHPSDKAKFTFRVTTPRDRTAVANGHLVATTATGDRKTTVYRTRDDIPTDVVQVAVGDFDRIDQTGPHGIPVHSYVPHGNAADAANARHTPDQIAWLEQQIGRPFPFEDYGVLAVNTMYGGVALECPTISTYSAPGLAQPTEGPVQVHEMTHQYFGDAVSVADWDDMWLSEGHATYYQWQYAEHIGQGTFLDTAKNAYRINDQQRADGGPVARMKTPAGVLFNTDAAGALTLYALHNTVGEATFRRIEQTFYDTYHGSSATTQDYIDVANRVSGRDLTGLFRSWLYGTKTPPMPGHPDWRPGPVQS